MNVVLGGPWYSVFSLYEGCLYVSSIQALGTVKLICLRNKCIFLIVLLDFLMAQLFNCL